MYDCLPSLLEKLRNIEEEKQDRTSVFDDDKPWPEPGGRLPPPGLALPATRGMQPSTMPAATNAFLGSSEPGQGTSVGTMGHPEVCGQACRYVRRKGGCVLGADCPDCHQCIWRRGLPPKSNREQLQPSTNEASSSASAWLEAATTAWRLSDTPVPATPKERQPLHISAQLQREEALRRGVDARIIQPPGFMLCSPQKEQGTQGLPCSALTLPAPPQQSGGFSVGTVGHPHTCNQACRYVWRKVGCRLGTACPDCHQCAWRRGLDPNAPHDAMLQKDDVMKAAEPPVTVPNTRLSGPRGLDNTMPAYLVVDGAGLSPTTGFGGPGGPRFHF